MYEQEFMANLETPEQVREKMAQRLAELKQKREQERQDEVNRRLEQRFRDSNFHASINSAYSNRRVKKGRVKVCDKPCANRKRKAIDGEAKTDASKHSRRIHLCLTLET